MMNLEFSWDPDKARINQRKHGVSFEEAQTAFYDPSGLIIHDPDHSFAEDRFILLAMSLKLRLLIVCHAYKNLDSQIRIISARKATKPEQNQYGGSKP